MALFKKRASSSPEPEPENVGAVEADGPRDRSAVPDVTGLVDLGPLAFPAAPGMELRLELDQSTQAITAATVIMGQAIGQFQAFAAPRSSGIWDEVRDEIVASLEQQGGSATVTEGPFGPELIARMPGRGADGKVSYQPARFIGYDGPRWFVRLVLTGQAAVDPGVAEPLLELFRHVVVTRGDAAMPPREVLPLHVPSEASPTTPAPQPGTSGLRPFERGPEITEIR